MQDINDLKDRKHTLFTSSVTKEVDEEVYVLGESLTDLATSHSFAYLAGSLWLGRKIKSPKTEEFLDLVLRLLVDHGPYVSGAVNTMVSARAGKDLVSSLVSGLLTIGPRFGGAINSAAQTWFTSVTSSVDANTVVEEFAKRKEYISGIGHRKYRLDLPDPRVKLLKNIGLGLKTHTHLDFALAIESVTTAKKPNLILNVDGVIAAVMLDLLIEEENLSPEEVNKLISAEFFNALFVLSRSVGFIAHYLDQKRLGEGLFRLSPEHVLSAEL